MSMNDEYENDYSNIDDYIKKSPPPYTIHECSATQRIFNVYISQEIGDPHQYIDFIEKLRLGSQSDIFYLYLNTPGGCVDTGAQIIHAINDSQARVIGVLDGTVCSMGALLFLACDEYIVHDYSRLMFHNYSGGVTGKGHEQIAQLNATSEWYTNMLMNICTPFLDAEELTEVLKGHDLWLNPEQVRERLEDLIDKLRVEEEEVHKQILIEQEKKVLKRIAAREKKEERRKKREQQKNNNTK